MVNLVHRDPNGAWIITHTNGMFLADLACVWSANPDKAVCFAEEQDAWSIADGLVNSRAVLGGVKTFNITPDGSVTPCLHVLQYR